MRQARTTDDRGYVMVLSALLLVPLMAFTGLAVDIGSWYVQASETHKAADAAALAGVVWLPDFTAAESRALESAARNGYDNADPSVTVIVSQTGATKLRVEIVDNDVPLFFAGLFVDDVSISRSSTAEYQTSVPMGNPESYLGTDPERGLAEDNYLSMSGAGTNKKGGDRFASKNCDAALCTPGPLGNLPSNGGEYRENGYLFTSRVNALAGQPLVVEVYDPGFYEGAQTCNNHGNFPAGYDFNDLLTGGLAALFPGDGSTDAERVAHWTERYANTPGAIYCSGDTPNNGTGAVQTFIVREPDLTPFDDYDNTVVCTAQFDAYDEDFYALLELVGTPHPYADTFAAEFRRWAEICRIDPADVKPGDYLIQVKNNAPMGSPFAIDGGSYDGGRNHFSLRSRWDDGTAFNGANLELFANGAMAIDANVPGSTTEMELARVIEVYAGQTLQVEMWDVADASGAGTLTLLPPVESPTVFTNCDFSNTKVGWVDTNPSDCAATVTNANMNGELLTAQVTIPLGYDCDEASAVGCFIRVLVDFPVGTSVYDHTTWSIALSGDPIRLVE